MFDFCIYAVVWFGSNIQDIVCYDDFGWRASFISTATSYLIILVKYLGFILARLLKGGKMVASNSFVYSFNFHISSTRLVLNVIIYHVELNGLSFTLGSYLL